MKTTTSTNAQVSAQPESFSARRSEVSLRPAKIRDEHLTRPAFLYIRQSTGHQIADHPESTDRQYALADRIIDYGWHSANVVVIDEDLGLSGSGRVERAGFRRLMEAVTTGQAGLVMGLEMSRLARNSRDWHGLFEVCGVFDTLLADEDGVYDPHDPNDRLVLGLKGLISEMELHTMKLRLERGRFNKARRGELFHSVPRGYIKSLNGSPEKDPDQQVQTVIALLFEKFEDLGSAHALFRWLVDHDIRLPLRTQTGRLEWGNPGSSTVLDILHNPMYAGAYGYGRRDRSRRRTASRHADADALATSPKTGRKHLPPHEWKVLIKDCLPGYITWQQYETNLLRLEQNRVVGTQPGPSRPGQTLLAGLLRCGQCGRRMQVTASIEYSGSYVCTRASTMAVPSGQHCPAVNCNVVDTLVAEQLLKALTPASITLSRQVANEASEERQRLMTLLDQQCERARYECELARRRFEAVDPDNRLVAATLEKAWEAALSAQQEVEQNRTDSLRDSLHELSASEVKQLQDLSLNIPQLWNHTTTTNVDRREIARLVIEHVVVCVEDSSEQFAVTIHWSGGYESRHARVRPVATYDQLTTLPEILALVIEHHRAGSRAPEIASALNAAGHRTAKRRAEFTEDMVRCLLQRDEVQEAVERRSLRESEWEVSTLAERLGMPRKKLKDWVTRGWLHAVQRPFGGRWIVWADTADLKRLQMLAARSRKGAAGHAPELTTPRFRPAAE